MPVEFSRKVQLGHLFLKSTGIKPLYDDFIYEKSPI
jgi:hypothetical protein